MSKTHLGNFFEDFVVGHEIVHATPRTVTSGDVAIYTALYGPRFAVQSSERFAHTLGYPHAPVDDLLVFHIVFGKTVPDISLNAVANLGYADCRFLHAVYPGDTLRTVSTVVGVKETSSGETGVVYVRSTGFNQHDTVVLDYVRWVLVRKRDATTPAPEPVVPTLPGHLDADQIGDAVPLLNADHYDRGLAGGAFLWGDYEIGERIDHVDGMTVEEAEHQLATRLYQNTAKVHFNQHTQAQAPIGRRLVYGGHVISLARSLSFNGLENAFHIAAINAGRHVNPLFAGDTVYAWSEVTDRKALQGRTDVGALRLRTIATKDRPCNDFPLADADHKHLPEVVLDLDYWVLMPR
ncbi:MAG: MaoC family dehydratase [Pseudomonadota bacterium]